RIPIAAIRPCTWTRGHIAGDIFIGSCAAIEFITVPLEANTHHHVGICLAEIYERDCIAVTVVFIRDRSTGTSIGADSRALGNRAPLARTPFEAATNVVLILCLVSHLRFLLDGRHARLT